MIRMDVRVDHMRDFHALRVREGDVFVNIFYVRIDHRALTQRAATQKIGRTPCRGVVVGFENHRASVPVAIRKSRARHSTMPCSKRSARKPFFLSNSTASTAMTQY